MFAGGKEKYLIFLLSDWSIYFHARGFIRKLNIVKRAF